MATVTDKMNFELYFILINLNLNSHMWLVATILENSALVYKFRDGGCHFSLVIAVLPEPSIDPLVYLTVLAHELTGLGKPK